MAEGPIRDTEQDAIEQSLSTLLQAIASEPVSDRIAALAADLQRALERRKAEERTRAPR